MQCLLLLAQGKRDEPGLPVLYSIIGGQGLGKWTVPWLDWTGLGSGFLGLGL